MAWSSDRKLDVAGAGLAIVLLLAIALGVFGALEAASGGGEAVPEANFSTERINDTHTRLIHEGGETIRGEELSVTINGRERVVGFPAAVGPGTSVTVRVRAGRTLRIYWTAGRGTRERIDEVTT